VLVCREFHRLPICTVVALGEKLKGGAISELRDVLSICRGEMRPETCASGREVQPDQSAALALRALGMSTAT
jgi:hypothetical protein